MDSEVAGLKKISAGRVEERVGSISVSSIFLFFVFLSKKNEENKAPIIYDAIVCKKKLCFSGLGELFPLHTDETPQMR